MFVYFIIYLLTVHTIHFVIGFVSIVTRQPIGVLTGIDPRSAAHQVWIYTTGQCMSCWPANEMDPHFVISWSH